MLLREQLEQALDRLAEEAICATTPRPMTLTTDRCQITCAVTAVGALGCAIQSLTLSTTGPTDATVEQLQEIADGLARQLTYLLEPVATIETDVEQQVVQMRSDPPHREEQQRSYYELLVRAGGHLELRRFQKCNGQARQQVPAQFTREVLARLVNDFAAAVTD